MKTIHHIIYSLLILVYGCSSTTQQPQVYYYSNGKMKSEGMYSWVSGRQGEWKTYYNNERIKSIYHYTNSIKQGPTKGYYKSGGKQWEGNYGKGKRVGPWKWYYEFGQVKEESNYQNGLLEGASIIYYPNGQIKKKMTYVKGILQGEFRYYNQDGSLRFTQMYNDGLTTLERTSFWGNGNPISKGKIVNNLFEGDWIFYYENGNIQAQGEYEEGNKIGKWVYYHENGKIKDEGMYKNGKLYGEWIGYYPDGSLYTKERYDSWGNLTGTYTLFYQDGKISITGNYEKGKREGSWVSYYKKNDSSDHPVQFVLNYEKGIRNGLATYYYKNGLIKYKGTLSQGNKVGTWVHYYSDGSLKTKITYFDNGNGVIIQEAEFYNPDGSLALVLNESNFEKIDSNGGHLIGKDKNGKEFLFESKLYSLKKGNKKKYGLFNVTQSIYASMGYMYELDSTETKSTKGDSIKIFVWLPGYKDTIYMKNIDYILDQRIGTSLTDKDSVNFQITSIMMDSIPYQYELDTVNKTVSASYTYWDRDTTLRYCDQIMFSNTNDYKDKFQYIIDKYQRKGLDNVVLTKGQYYDSDIPPLSQFVWPEVNLDTIGVQPAVVFTHPLKRWYNGEEKIVNHFTFTFNLDQNNQQMAALCIEDENGMAIYGKAIHGKEDLNTLSFDLLPFNKPIFFLNQ